MPLPVDVVSDLDDTTIARARLALERAVEPDLRDDRFADGWVSSGRSEPNRFLAALPRTDDGPIGFLGGVIDGTQLRLDALVERRNGHDQAEVLDQLLAAVIPAARERGVTEIELWGHPAEPFHRSVAAAHAMVEVRALHQMRCPLPVAAEELPTRAFRPGVDDEAVLAVNNRAFRDHPDQGRWTLEDLRARFREPWFDADGLRVHERAGRVIGFCWTKVHRDPDLGEIYVIGIDPDHHGKGLGVPMTAAGLRWLSDRGLRTGMLYVEADNAPALRTYQRLGFVPVRTDRAWRLTIG